MTVIDSVFDLDNDKPFTVRFTDPHLHDVLEIGRGKHKFSRGRGHKPKAGHPNDKKTALADDETGILGEAAVAQLFDWHGEWAPSLFARRRSGDVAGIEVRSSRKYPNLIIRPDDPLSREYVCCRVHQRPESTRVEILGWIIGDEAVKLGDVKHTNGRPPFYSVPPDRLRPMRELWLLREDEDRWPS